MARTKTHDLRIMLLKLQESVRENEGYLYSDETDQWLLPILDIVSQNLDCRPAIRGIIESGYGFNALQGAHKKWREEWLKKR